MRRRARAIRDPDPRLREKRTSKNPLQSNTNSTRWQMFPTRKWDRKWLLRCAAWRPLEKTNNLCGCNKILWLWNGRCCLSCKRNDLGGWCRLSTFSGLGTNTRWIRVNMSGGAMRSEQRETWMQNSNVAILLLHSQQLGEVFNFDVSASANLLTEIRFFAPRHKLRRKRMLNGEWGRVHEKHMSQPSWITQPGNPFQFSNEFNDEIEFRMLSQATQCRF